jgi:hypothetical protein
MFDSINAVATEIAAAVMASCAPGTLPTSEMLLQKFCDAYKDAVPSDFVHRRVCDIVRAKIGL